MTCMKRGVHIKSFIGLKLKMYTFTTEDTHESKRAKCINRNVVDYELQYEDCKIVFFSRSYMRY